MIKYYTIYKITNLINRMIYIGHHTCTNLDNSYMGSGREIRRAIVEFGKENFEKEILFIFDNLNDMIEKEIELVDDEFRKRDDTYNLALGGGCFGMLGVKLSTETREKMSKSHTGVKKFFSQQHRENISKSKKGKAQTSESNRKRSESLRGRKRKPHSEETKQKIRETRSKNEYIISDENRKKISERGKGTIWISNILIKKTKMIKLNLLKKFIDDDWIVGRKKFKE